MAVLCLGLATANCNGCKDPVPTPDGNEDAAVDVGTDTSSGMDAGADAAPTDDMQSTDTGTDAAADAAPDAQPDMSTGELCDNGSDDDGDGDVDCRDTDCDTAPACVATAVATGWTHACAVFEDGRVRCWGDNSDGQLGNGSTDADPQPPVQVDGIDDAVDVVAGEGFSCALHDDQTVSCWGLNEVGQLGDASFVDSSLPVKVVGLGDAIDIAAGETNACAISEAEGQVVCWGGDDEGQLGNGGDDEPSNEPVDVDLFAIVTIVPFDGATDVECGWRSCCAVRDDTTAGCWGRNAQGGLAGGSTIDASPLALATLDELEPARALENVADVGVAANFTCFALDDNSVWCAGEVPALQIDYPGSPELPRIAVELDLFADAVEIWGGTGHACSLRTSGRVLCWGNNGEYQAGDPDGGFSDGYQLPDLQDPIDFAAGERFNCFVDTEGKVSCFGNNEFRQLGVDTTEDAVAEAQRVIF